jgi:hypothetical protein
MSQPFSGIPDPGAPSPFRRRVQPRVFQDALLKVLRGARRYSETALRAARHHSERALRGAQGHGQSLWLRANRSPRTVGLVGGAVAMTLIGAYALSASGRSLCPPAGEAKKPQFLLLMDSVPHPAAGSELTIEYDVCGLKSGTPYRGRVQLIQKPAASKKTKKKSAKPKPLVVTFHDEVDGLSTRRSQQLKLGTTKPGAYTLELSVVDNQGRKRTKLQKVLVKANS